MKKIIFGKAIFLISILVFLSGLTHAAIPAEERAALIALYNATNGDNWTNNDGWKTPPLDSDDFAMPGTEGTWFGITILENHVTKIELDWNDLDGNIPFQLGNLSNLQTLDLSVNYLNGSIPQELGNLSNLKELYLDWNKLTGSIPSELGNSSNLRHLSLYINQLNGIIPKELGNLINLTHLILYSNKLSGSIPSELGYLINLQDLELHLNQLTGSIPRELGNIINLEILQLDSNHLSGNIPLELGNLINLWNLRLNKNNLSGAIPKSLINLTKLHSPWFDIGYNCLYTNDAELRVWLDSVDPDWESNQNECGFNLIVQSSPDTGVPITVSPNDNYGQGNGNTEFFRTYDPDIVAVLTAPVSYNGKLFVKWLIDGKENSNRTIQITMDSNHTVKAVYQSVTYTLTVKSSPSPGVDITVNPIDNSGNGDGNTDFSRIYDSGIMVTLTAPSSSGDNDFVRWTVDGNNYNEKTIPITMDSNHTAVVYYAPPPEISVNRTSLNFGYIIGSNNLPVESFTITNRGGGTLNWTASCEVKYVSLSPGSGANSGVVNVSIDPVGLIPGKFRGVIYVSDPLASNSPVDVEINLWVKKQSESSPPFGEFSTPLDNSTVRSSVPVTGWALGDTGIGGVKIYREEGKNLVFIGDAVFVEGARPDVEAAYPDYPMNYKAGWGYMMLTNFLPNGGNGVFKIHAIATDQEGQKATLGVKTIIVDNANAVKPFGAIDTPAQGGTASGSNFVNWGWVLTPQPNTIPTDGSTINVYVDGVMLGHPTYNIYREDIATLFPGYANSEGAAGYFSLDTTTYENGVHTIQWIATDDGDNTDGIGSRYFTIQNSGGASGQRSLVTGHWSFGSNEISQIPIDYFSPVIAKKGVKSIRQQRVYPDDEGIVNIEIKELERLEIQLSPNTSEIYGYMVVGNKFRALPIGSNLDRKTGIFSWQSGVGFVGDYKFVFVEKGAYGVVNKRNILVNILPMFENTKDEKKN